MATHKARRNVSYGMTNALQNIGPMPIISKSSAPSTSNIAELGTIWVKKSTSQSWVLAKIAAGSATWTPLTVNAGAIITTGDLEVTAGSVLVGDDSGGTLGYLTITNVVETLLGLGEMTVLSTTGNGTDSDGWLKLYNGTTTVWVPFWNDIAP